MVEQTAPRLGWVENRPTRGARALRLKELWEYRDLIGFLALRDFKVRYKQAIFGIGWAILQPVSGAVAFTLIFDKVAKLPSDGIPYPIFSFCGVAVWSYVSSAINAGRSSLVTNVPLITKVYFARLCLPVAAVLPGLVDFAVALTVLGGLIVWYGIDPGLSVFAMPLFVLGAAIVAIGTSTLFATLTVEYRDIHQVFNLLLQLWLFASPIAYPTSVVHGWWRWLYAANPMVGVVDGFRWALLNGPPPGATTAVSTASALVILVLGLRVFQRAERRFADVI